MSEQVVASSVSMVNFDEGLRLRFRGPGRGSLGAKSQKVSNIVSKKSPRARSQKSEQKSRRKSEESKRKSEVHTLLALLIGLQDVNIVHWIGATEPKQQKHQSEQKVDFSPSPERQPEKAQKRTSA